MVYGWIRQAFDLHIFGKNFWWVHKLKDTPADHWVLEHEVPLSARVSMSNQEARREV